MASFDIILLSRYSLGIVGKEAMTMTILKGVIDYDTAQKRKKVGD